MSDSIVIAYGVEPSLDTTDPRRHDRISLRDLEAAYEISHFLIRQYPHKSVLPIPAGTPGWQNWLRPETSLIIVGGFVTNSAFASYQAQIVDGSYSLRRGRLCGIEERIRGVREQRVFPLQLKNIPGVQNPSPNDPQALDDTPSERIARDYGLVTSRNAIINGKERRVVSVAGVRGYGTLGAAKALTGEADQPVGLNKILTSPLKRTDVVEMIVATDVTDLSVNRTEIVEVVFNKKRVHRSQQQDWELCNLGWPCAGCTFGLTGMARQRS